MLGPGDAAREIVHVQWRVAPRRARARPSQGPEEPQVAHALLLREPGLLVVGERIEPQRLVRQRVQVRACERRERRGRDLAVRGVTAAFVRGQAKEDRHVAHRSGRSVRGQAPAVRHEPEAPADQGSGGRQRAQRRERAVRESPRPRRARLLRLGERQVAVGRATAHQDGAVEEPCRQGRANQRAGQLGARRLPGERHATGVTTEGRDVPPDPLQRGDAIEQPVVPGDVPRGLRAQPGMREEAECAQAVVDGHHHEAATGELGAVVHGHRAGSSGQRAAVQPHEHRALRAAWSLRGPEVEVEAVLTRPLLRDELRRPGRRGPWHLLAARSDAVGPAHTAPGRRRLRRLPPERPDRRPRIGHPPEDEDAGHAARDAFDPPALDVHRARLRQGRRRHHQRQSREAGRRPELAYQPPNEMMQMVSGDVGDHPARRPAVPDASGARGKLRSPGRGAAFQRYPFPTRAATCTPAQGVHGEPDIVPGLDVGRHRGRQRAEA